MSNEVVEENLISINSVCSLIKFTGNNSIDFLNNLLISDLPKLKKNNLYYTALCNPKGRIISSLWIIVYTDSIIELICPKNSKEHLINFFTIRKFRLKIDINESKKFLYLGNQSIIIDTNKHKAKSVENEFNIFHIENNLPWIDEDFSGKFIPQHVNLDQHKSIMSFTKGCYPGQEIIARIKYIGKIKKRMHLMENSSKDELKKQIKNIQPVSKIYINIKTKLHVIQVVNTCY